MEKSPYDKCRFVYDIHASLVNLVGLHVVDKNYKMNVRTLIPIYVEVNYLSLLIYTLIHYKNEPFKALIATPAAGIIIPVSLLQIFYGTIVILKSECKCSEGNPSTDEYFLVFDYTTTSIVSTNASAIAKSV